MQQLVSKHKKIINSVQEVKMRIRSPTKQKVVVQPMAEYLEMLRLKE